MPLHFVALEGDRVEHVLSAVCNTVAYARNAAIDAPIEHASLYLTVLAKAVHRRVAAINRAALGPRASPVGILFSGGIDSTMIAALAHIVPAN